MLIQYSKTSFVNHPVAMGKYLLGGKESLHEKIMLRTARTLLKQNFNSTAAQHYLKEIRDGDFIKMNSAGEEPISGNKPGHLFGKLIYFLVRCMRPDVMIETGVAHGVSSWTILNAMHKNQCGKLYSIDLPDLDTRQTFNVGNMRQEPGWVVPELLRSRWELHLGKSSEILPGLLTRVKKIDIFFHDSDHSYENMIFEFRTAYDFIRSGGLLLSDDVHKNLSFRDFTNEKKMVAIQLFSKGGAAVKDA